MKITGTSIGICEILIFIYFSNLIKYYNPKLENLDNLSYYWLCMTVLTGFWESVYIYNIKKIIKYSHSLLENNKHVWDNKYNLTYILPWKLSKIFYAEYGAWADREYMIIKNEWSQYIEGTHAILCGLFSLFGLLLLINNNSNYIIYLSAAMGAQLMNSILYMKEYFIQTKLKNSVNFNNNFFPCGNYLVERPFMYVNIFWTIMPIYVIINLF
tara:strand:+ start:1359 stop:1997 length:639 start_codon:yes stop_codon:yes gene_type:complete